MIRKKQKDMHFFLNLFMGFLIACTPQLPGEKILFDFETEGELDRIHWKCFTLYLLSKDHVTRGNRALRMELYPSNYPGFASEIDKRNWQGYKAFALDIYNPERKEILITVRIDDRKNSPEFRDRYNEKFVLEPGKNSILISTDTLRASGTKRKLDLHHIYKFYLFMVQPKTKHVLYMDNMRLM